MAISTLKQVRNKNLCLSCIVHCVYNSNYFDFRVVYDSKCPILSPIHTRKRGPVMSSLKTIRYVAREEKLFQTRVRCFQDLPLQNTSPSLEIVHFFPLLHDVLLERGKKVSFLVTMKFCGFVLYY